MSAMEAHYTPLLQYADPPYSVPYKSLFKMTAFGILLNFGVPFLFFAGNMAKVRLAQPQTSLHPDFYDIKALAFSCIFVWFALVFYHFHRSGASSSEESQTQRSSWPSVIQALLVATVMSAVPLGTSASTCLWWNVASTMYLECSLACKELRVSSSECSDNFPFSGTEYPVHLPAESMNMTWTVCRSVVSTQNVSQYVESMYYSKHPFLAYESLLRIHHGISTVDVYGSLFGGLWLVVILVAGEVMRKKRTQLQQARDVFIQEQLVIDVGTANRFFALFSYLDELQIKAHDKHKDSKMYITNYCKQAVKEYQGGLPRTSNKDVFNRVSAKVKDADMDGVNDGESFSCQFLCRWRLVYGSLLAGGLIILVAAVHVLISAFERIWLFQFHQKGKFWQSWPYWLLSTQHRFHHLIGINILMTFIAQAALFGFMLFAYLSYSSNLNRFLAFDCLWRFPDEEPLDSIQHTHEDSIRVIQVELKQDRKYTWFHHKDKTKDYVADFAIRTFDELANEVRTLKEWFGMRRYLQLDSIDDRIAAEIFAGISTVTLLPQIIWISSAWVSIVSGGIAKTNAAGVVGLWDTVSLLTLVGANLVLTLQINDIWEAHTQRLNSLKSYLEYKFSEERVHSTGESQVIREESKFKLEAAQVFIEKLTENINRFEKPATFFGLRVDRNLLNGLTSTMGLLLLPNITSLIQQVWETN